MPARSKQRKRKRASIEKVETILADSDNEVSFRVKRPRRDSTGSNSNSSLDSGFKSNCSSSGNVCKTSENNEALCNSTFIKDVAVYYAKKSPAKYPLLPTPQLLSNDAVTRLLFSDQAGITGHAEKKIQSYLPNQCKKADNSKSSKSSGTIKNSRSSSDSVTPGDKKNRNIKGLNLDVDAMAKRRKVENIIECKSPNKILPRRSPNGYLLPEPVPIGIILSDLMQNRWKIGKSIGVGGFGEIYSAEHLNEGISAKSASNYVVKVEPHSNGPLFVETNFYLRATRKESIEHWKQERGVVHLGVPRVEGSGSFRLRGKKFRFLVIPRYGTDLQTLLDQSGSTLSVDTACSIAKQVIDSYEYIHSKGYVHKDCKGSNILFINRGSTVPEVTKHTPMRKICLVDYGLVSKYVQEGGLHKPYRIDERSAHEGTLEYTSRDAHLGCVSRRGDLEVLFYCLIEWLGGKLPWDQPQQPHPKEIHKSKISAFQNIDKFLEKSFSDGSEDIKVPPQFLNRMMNYIEDLAFEEKPDYNYTRSIFQKETGPRQFHFSSSTYSSEDEEVNLALSIRSKPYFVTPPPLSPIAGSSSDSNDDTDDEVAFKPQISAEKVSTRTPRTRHMDEANIKQRLEERILAERAKTAEQEVTRLSYERFLKDRDMFYKKICIKSLRNPTPAMVQQLDRIEGRRRNFQRSLSEIDDSPFRRSKFGMVGAKRARSRSLVIYNTDKDLYFKSGKSDTKEQTPPKSLQFRKTIQRRKGAAVKMLFNPSPGVQSNASSSTKILRRAHKSGKFSSLLNPSKDVKKFSRRRHRSGPAKEVTFPSLIDENIEGVSQDLFTPKATSPFRRSKRVGTLLPTQDKRSGFSKHVQDFSSIFNKALSNVTKSILRYNSKP